MAARRNFSKEIGANGEASADAPGVEKEDHETDDKHPSSKKRRKRSEACRAFLLSPAWKFMMLGVVGVVPVFGVLAFMPTGLAHLGCTGYWCMAKYYGFAVYVSVMFLYNFAMSQFTDAGGTDHVKPTFEPTGQYLMQFAGEVEHKQIDSDEPLMYAPNYCDHCKRWKPPRSHHCSFCKRCTLRMDHHCPFTGNCIGLHNHGHFVLMYIFAVIGVVYSFTLSGAALYHSHVELEKRGRYLRPLKPISKMGIVELLALSLHQLAMHTELTVGVQLIASGIALTAVAGFGFGALYQASLGRTMLETVFPMKEYVQIKKQVYCPLGQGFYGRSCRQNLRDILGPSWLRRLLLPVKGDPVGLHIAIAPIPSDAGLKALLERIDEVQREVIKAEVRTKEELGINEGPDSKSSGRV